MNLKQDISDILFSDDDFSRIKTGIDNLYQKFSEITQIFAGDVTHEYMKETRHGKIVTPVQAAHCLMDIGRTTRFLRAIHRAIEDYLEKKSHIRILYAGCGPYATLLTPFTALYPPDKIRFTFIEIEPICAQAVQKLYHHWQLTPYLEQLMVTDATNPNIEFPQPFDIIISETMQVGLKNECQVPITRNLVRFIARHGTFIPQSISLDVVLTGHTSSPLTPDPIDKLFIGTAYNLDFRNVPPPNHQTFVTIPPNHLEFLKLYTTLHLYKDEKLTAYQSGLTLPLTLDRRLADKRNTQRKARFWYDEGPRPELKFEYAV